MFLFFSRTGHFQLHLHLLLRAQQQMRLKQKDKKLLRRTIACCLQSVFATLHLSMH